MSSVGWGLLDMAMVMPPPPHECDALATRFPQAMKIAIIIDIGIGSWVPGNSATLACDNSLSFLKYYLFNPLTKLTLAHPFHQEPQHIKETVGLVECFYLWNLTMSCKIAS